MIQRHCGSIGSSRGSESERLRILTLPICLAVALMLSGPGCRKSSPDEAAAGGPDASAEQLPSGARVRQDGADGANGAVDPGDGATPGTPDDELLWTSRSAEESPAADESSLVHTHSTLQLPPTRSYPELVQFLAQVDREIQRLGTQTIDPGQRESLIVEMRRVAKMKQEAAQRMLEDENLADQQRTLAIRARMQALSHQAALGDLAAANALEAYAIELLNYPVDDIARDSRTVLVGFALERLQGGVTQQPDEVLRFIGELMSQPDLLDASSIKVTEQAMLVLTQYGYSVAAQTVREQLETFVAQTDDPVLAALAEGSLESNPTGAAAAIPAESDGPEARD